VTSVGIVSYGLYLPAAVESAEALAGRSVLSIEQWHALGVRQKCRPSREDQPVVMAARAAEQAFAAADSVTPPEVDVLIYTGEEYKDYIAQTASIRLQEELGCGNAYAFDLVGQGVTTIVGLRVAHDMICGTRRFGRFCWPAAPAMSTWSTTPGPRPAFSFPTRRRGRPWS